MRPNSRRPFAVILTVEWGLILGGMLVARAVGSPVVPPIIPDVFVPALLQSSLEGVLAVALVSSSVFVFMLKRWAPRIHKIILLLTTFSALVPTFYGYTENIIIVTFCVASGWILTLYADRFRNERPDIDDSGSAVFFGTH